MLNPNRVTVFYRLGVGKMAMRATGCEGRN